MWYMICDAQTGRALSEAGLDAEEAKRLGVSEEFDGSKTWRNILTDPPRPGTIRVTIGAKRIEAGQRWDATTKSVVDVPPPGVTPEASAKERLTVWNGDTTTLAAAFNDFLIATRLKA